MRDPHQPGPVEHDSAKYLSPNRLKSWAARLKTDTYALYLAGRDPRTPRHVRLLVAAVVAYALSPIDLIPDFIPVLGYLDDLVLVPLGIALAIKMIPSEVLEECREKARDTLPGSSPRGLAAAVVIAAFWLMLLLLAARAVFQKI